MNDLGIELDAPVEEALPGQELPMSQAIMVELVKLRKKRKIGQAPIAKAIGMSQAGVSQIENLKRGVSLESVLIYAKAIGAKITIESEDEGSRGANGKR
jgi:transcriptional regulator with XRE-family HTH domain